jgi:hypothetical protein
MKLSFEEFCFLKNELDSTPIMNDDEIKFAKSAHPQLYYSFIGKKDDGVALITEKTIIYSLRNENLNDFLCEKFDESLENLYMIHKHIYGVNDFAQKHKDRFTTHKTVSLILSDEFEGGDMYINDKKVKLNKKGEYVVFHGGNDFHEVTPVTKGNREVLIIWFSKKQSKFSLL